MRFSGWARLPLPWDGAIWLNSDRCSARCPQHSLPPVADYIGKGHMVHEHSPIGTEVSACHKSLCSEKHHQER